MRVFAGIPLPDKAKQSIGIWIDENRNTFKGLKFVNPELLHITLYFFGELEQEEVEKLKLSIAAFKGAAVKASLGGISFFPSFKKPNVFYISIEQGGGEVSEIYSQFELSIKKIGYISRGKKFIPHITFARRKKRKSNAGKEDWSFFKSKNFNIRDIILDRLVLYQSVLKPEGPEYFPLKEILLENAAGNEE